MTSGDAALAKALAKSKSELLFHVSRLRVEYQSDAGALVQALRGVDLEIAPGQTIGVLGESGSGKSSLALALMRLLPRNARVAAGFIEHRGKDLFGLGARQLREIRGAEVSLISQEPALALNPVLTLGTQLKDVLKAHASLDRAHLESRCNEILGKMGFEDPERVMRAYPHQLSGGQRQRVAIAQALICRPQLLIADEPLSSLDAATQAEIVAVLQRLKTELGLAMLFITHNAGVLRSLADQVIVLREGEIHARGSIDELQRNPDAYVQELIYPEKSVLRAGAPTPSAAPPLLEICKLSKSFLQRRLFSRKKFRVQSLDSVDLVLQQGATTAVLGRSGSGKSTLGRCIAGFETPDAGQILFDGRDQKNPRSVQMIFQDASTSLNPRFTARQIVAEPLEIARWKTEHERTGRVLELMQEVGLDPAAAGRLAGEFSGGQRQRLALARALAAEPRLLILDEALSGLDVPLQAQMVRLLMDLQARHGLTYLYISHDLNFISLFAQEIIVMEAGRIVERLTPSELARSNHPATRALVEAAERLHAPGVETAV